MAPFSVVEDLDIFEQADIGGLVVEPAFVVGQLGLDLRVIDPDPQIVDAFDSYTSHLDERIRSNIAASRTLAALRYILLPKLMSGELRGIGGCCPC